MAAFFMRQGEVIKATTTGIKVAFEIINFKPNT